MDKPSEAESDSVPEQRPHSGWTTPFQALRYRNYRILWVTTMMVAGGVWLQQPTLGWLAFEMTDSALHVSGVLGVRSAPLLLAPFTGVIIDRVDRRKLLIVDQILVTSVVFGFAFLLFSGAHQLWHVYAFALAFGLLWAINNPVRQTLVANSVPRSALMNATALNALAFNSMRSIGPGVGGFLIALVGPGINFLLQGILFTGVLLMLIPYRAEYGTGESALARSRSPFRNLIEGFGYVLSHRPTLILLSITFMMTLTMLGLVMNLMAAYVPEVLNDDEGDVLGILLSVLGIGGVVGTALIATFSNFKHKGVQTLVSFGCAALGVIVASQVGTIWAAALAFLWFSVFAQSVMTTNMTLIQGMTPDRLRGRVVGVYQMEIGFMPIGGVIAGAIATVWGIDTAFLVGGIAALAFVVLIAVLSPELRKLQL